VTLREARQRGRAALDEPGGKRLVAAFGIDVPRGVVVAGAADIEAAASGLAPPFAVKLVSPDAVHKSDIGAVRVGIADAAAASRAVEDMASIATRLGLRVDGYLIEEMAPKGRELVVGGALDARFGPIVMLGIGGIFVEIFEDIAFRVCPIDAADAADMLDELKGARLLGPVRGMRGVNRDAVMAALLAVGGAEGLLMRAGGTIREVDINPLIASEEGAMAADVRVLLGSAS
jgi:hypothetical protein